uniref:Uncharacterized protein n=1 Tax=Caenorhabditis japonica TaxID=281687 RepID=A0A8R1ET19_CAEJA
MGRGMDPYMIRYRSTRPRGGSVDCFGVGRRGSTPAWNIYGGLVDPWENGNISDLICFHVSLVEGVWNFLDLRNALLLCVSADLVICYLIDRGLNFFLGDMF